jgi:uncharacterized integral membrane protein
MRTWPQIAPEGDNRQPFDFTPMEPLQKGEAMTTVTVVISFLILILLVVAGAQNSASLQIKIGWWNLQMSLTEVIFWAAVGGAAVIAVLSLPKMGKTYMETRRLHKEIRRLEKLCREPSEEVKET